MNNKKKLHERRKTRVRSKFTYSNKNRLCVIRSLNHISAQIVSPDGIIITSASTKDKSFRDEHSDTNLKKVEKAALIGKRIANLAQDKGLTDICFDRSGYLYHGRVKALADAAREAGLQF